MTPGGKSVLFSLGLAAGFAFAAPAQAGSVLDSNSIIGGVLVNAGDPVAQSTVGLTDGSFICSASIVAEDLAVTAAHCVAGGGNLMLVFSTDMTQSNPPVIKVSGFQANPSYSATATTDADDIALLHFTGGLPDGYAPAKIAPSIAAISHSKTAYLAGFGITNADTHAGAGILRKTSVKVAGPLGTTEVLLDQESGKGACHGDSGGPAFIMHSRELYLWGVTSRGYPDTAPDDCAHQVVYTDILSHLDWLGQATTQLRAAK